MKRDKWKELVVDLKFSIDLEMRCFSEKSGGNSSCESDGQGLQYNHSLNHLNVESTVTRREIGLQRCNEVKEHISSRFALEL